MLSDRFASRHEPIFLNEGSFHSELVLQKMEALRSVVDGRDSERLERDIALLRGGITGERRVAFELKNAHYPLVFVHDLNLELEDVSAQVDFLVISPSNAFVVECKNLVGDIEIQADGSFVRTFGHGSRRRREGIYSPVTQNAGHVELMKAIICAENGRLLSRLLGGALDTYFQSIVVLANDKSLLHMENAPKDVQAQVVRCDQLISHIKKLDRENRKKNGKDSFALIKDIAQGWLKRSKPVKVDLAGRYALRAAGEGARDAEVPGRNVASSQTDPQPVPVPVPVPVSAPAPIPVPVVHPWPQTQAGETSIPVPVDSVQPQAAPPTCPVCGSPMQLRTARHGAHKGEQFWGCSTYWATRCPGIVTIPR